MYDLLAGKENMESSYLMSKGKALEMFPMLKREGLVGAVVYYDGTFPRGVHLKQLIIIIVQDNTTMHA
jgi:glycerol-3-phosphate dehydrogenase